MQIITLEDIDFPDILEAFKGGKAVGKYWKGGQIQVVCATSQFLIVSHGLDPSKIAIKPTRSLNEAEDFAVRLLLREKDRGAEVEFSANYAR